MHKRIRCAIFILVSILAVKGHGQISPSQAKLFGTQDLKIKAKSMLDFQTSDSQQILVFDKGFELTFGDNFLKSEKAVVWLDTITNENQGQQSTEYKLTAYLQDKVSIKQGQAAKMAGIETQTQLVQDADSLVAKFTVTGEIFVTADKRDNQDPRQSELYRNAQIATGQIKIQPPTEEQQTQIDDTQTDAAGEQTKQNKTKKSAAAKAPHLNITGEVSSNNKTADNSAADEKYQTSKTQASPKTKKQKKPVQRTVKKPLFGEKKTPAEPNVIPPKPKTKINYPVNISSATQRPLVFNSENLPDGTGIATVMSRFYLWQKQDENGRTLELMADSAVIFYADKTEPNKNSTELASNNSVKGVYLCGDVIMTEGSRTIRAAEAYYDFVKKQALMIKPVVTIYDPKRGIPVYIRAEKIRQLSETQFSGENVTMTNSEFYVPQISATASKVFITDTTTIDQAAGKLDSHSYDAVMENVKMKMDDKTVFWWPRLRGNTESSDLPLKRIQFSNGGAFGTSVETEWYLARILGYKEPYGVESTMMLDTYSKRGIGAGADIDYQREKYFGNVNGYIINDKGEDDLGRIRKNIEPDEKLRGMFNFRHRHFLPEHWQLTLESSYISDETFLESFRREEFFEDRNRETSVHLKWLKDNQAFALLGRWRINNWADQLEDLPSAQYHLTGQSLWNDKLTLYNDSMLGRFRQRVGNNHNDLVLKDEYYTFGYNRTELDFPLQYKKGSIVPFVAGTYGYDDRSGFSQDATAGNGPNGDENVFIGEAGVRTSTQFWKHYNYNSQFWDVHGLRHIVKPYATASVFAENSKYVEQRDVYTLGVLQRWQTKRGVGDKQRLIDWMRLNLEYTKVSDPSSDRRPDRTLWNNPFVPLPTLVAPGIYNSDLGGNYRTFEVFGPQRDSVNGDYTWRLSDTTAILSDFNWDVDDAEIEQFNIGLSRLVWPNLSLYLGTRYMRSVQTNNNDRYEGSHALTFAATYKLTPRYMLAFSHQYDFERNGLVSTQVSLIRRYNRLFYAITYGVDESLDSRTISLTIWPEGVGELAAGKRNLLGLESPAERNY
jgi:hypothetical protein